MKFTNIRVFDSDLNFIKEVSNFRTLMYHSRWEDIGDFELHLDKPLPKIFQNGYYIMVNNDPRLTGVIEYEFNNGDAFLPDASKDFTIKGYSLLSLINRRISVPPTDGDGYRRWSGAAAETIIYDLVNENCVNPTDTKRVIEHLECATDKKRGKTITTETRYDNLTTFINTICKQSELGVAVELDAANKKFVFKVLEGTDRCYSSTNPNSFIFSKKFGRVVSQTSEHSTLGTANMAYVLGEGDGKDRKCVEIIKGNNGLRRRELYVDARDIANKSDDDPTYDAVLNLENRGDEKLAEVAETYSFEFEAGTREYRTAWNLGDKCTFRADDENVTQENIITEVTETWEGGKYTVEPVAGHTKTTILSAIQSAANSAVVERAGISQQFDEISANFIKVTQLIANKVDVSDLTAYKETVAQLVAGKADVDMLNVNDASITSAKIKDISADKITAGTIDASVVKVVNLSAENITVGKINGQQIAPGAIATTNLASDVTNNIDTAKTTAADAKTTADSVVERADNGEFDAVTIYLHSSAGTAFKNDKISTILSVVIYHGGKTITDKTGLINEFGSGAYLEWSVRKFGDSSFTAIISTDSHFSNDGFSYTVGSEDINTQAVFNVQLIV